MTEPTHTILLVEEHEATRAFLRGSADLRRL
jgi:hypothetical protein